MKYISTKKINKLNKQEPKNSDIRHWYSYKNFKLKEIKYIMFGQLGCVYHPSKIDIEEWTKLYFLFDQHNNFLKLESQIF